MKNAMSRPTLSAIFVDYDNIYSSLMRKNKDSAQCFAKEAHKWIEAITSGALISSNDSSLKMSKRRLVMNRCYGNPVPRRNTSDNATDMNSFAFVRHHFLRSGFEIIDCPPLTAQLKHSSDIRMVMDIRDFLDHKINFEEFIILSSDSDFTPVLHRLRAYAKRTIIYTNDDTATPYAALSDGKVRETDLITLLIDKQISFNRNSVSNQSNEARQLSDQIVNSVLHKVLESNNPVPLELLSESVIRAIGYENTVGTHWAGHGSLHKLLTVHLPDNVKLSREAPYFAYDVSYVQDQRFIQTPESSFSLPDHSATTCGTSTTEEENTSVSSIQVLDTPKSTQLFSKQSLISTEIRNSSVDGPDHVSGNQLTGLGTTELQETITRIQEACEAPPFSPPEYSTLLSILDQEISENQLQGVKTLQNIGYRAAKVGINISSDDVRYILDAVTEGDPWLDKGSSVALLSERLRSHVVRRCKEHGLHLSSAELELIDTWFSATLDSNSKSSETVGLSPLQRELQTTHEADASNDFTDPKLQFSDDAKSNEWERDDESHTNDDHLTKNMSDNHTSSSNLEISSIKPIQSLESLIENNEENEFPRIVRNRYRP
ncbi:MAG: hypothetical protein TECD_00434 [Hyphomicrobiaceae bacterium hypho_1]